MTLRCLLNPWRFIRLVYQVIDDMLIIAVVAVGKRERSNVYHLASERMK
ncbi:addiction module toxin RelE [Escherichia coli]|nr:addiction module toxin RelE [Escherichia coli]